MRRREIDEIVERIADAVIKRIDEQRNIELIAEAVLARLQENAGSEGEGNGGWKRTTGRRQRSGAKKKTLKRKT